MDTNDLSPKKHIYKHICNYCDYYSNKKTDFIKHLSTDKHHRLTMANKKSPEVAENLQDHKCICGNNYKHLSSLCKHKKTCKHIASETNTEINNIKIDELVQSAIKKNEDEFKKDILQFMKEFVKDQQNMFVEVLKNGTQHNTINNNNNISNNNSNNKAFNIQFYLNETCKNAMNITEFIDSIQLQLSDLTYVGENGYVKGISKIITDHLNKLDATIRPINCTDKKRDSIYIKDDNKWEKDEEQKKIKQVIKKVAIKNEKMFPKYKEKYPEYKDSESVYSDKYSKIVIESLDSSVENIDKIIKNISKVTSIDK